MDVNRLHEILRDCTVEFRKGKVFEGTPELVDQAERGQEIKGGGVLEVYMMPHVDEAPDYIELIDVEFEVIGVDKTKAETHRAELIRLLDEYPDAERLAGGPSYIEAGGVIGSQSGAFQLFALGKALGLWNIITPASMGFKGQEARDLAGRGFVMMTGYRKSAKAEH